MPVYRILKDTNLKETTRGLARLYTKLSGIVILHLFFRYFIFFKCVG
jgi:hypothetical protein